MGYPFQFSSIYQKAIEAALSSNWEEALKINRKIIKTEPQNVDALNRQARAYMELGKINLAKKYYCLALKFDPYNPIAIKNLKIIKSFKANGQSFISNGHTKLSPSLFLQEPGKTKIISLLKVAEPQKLSVIFCGMEVKMVIKIRKINIVDMEGNYLGVLPDDICYHLLRLIKGGNKYQLFIKSIKVNSLSVLIKEVFRSKRFKKQPSFLEYSPNFTTKDIVTVLDNNEAEEDNPEEEQDV
ncbi:hypothetical protein HY384_03205 [Candidatus Daviesbacteria bacterium]|nr:hypothetical protein [Candidatus Daviesbacteria bacterium]